MKLFLTIGIIASGSICLLKAQEASSAPSSILPEGPPLAKLPTDTRCVVTVTNLDAKPGDDGQQAKSTIVQRIKMLRSGDLGLDETVDFTTNQTTQIWTNGEYQVSLDSLTKEPNATKIDNSIYATPQFPGMDCVKAKNFQGIVTMQGRKCLRFKERAIDSEAESEAFVDLKTRLPISATVGSLGYAYQFSVVPSGSVVIPSEALKAVAEVKARYVRAALRAP